MGLETSSIKILGKTVQWFMSYDRTTKQTNRDYNFIYIYRLSTDYKDQMIFSVKGAEFQVTLHAEILMLDCKHKRKS